MFSPDSSRISKMHRIHASGVAIGGLHLSISLSIGLQCVNAVTVVILCRGFGAFGGDACYVENIENLYHKGPEKRVLFIELVQIF